MESPATAWKKSRSTPAITSSPSSPAAAPALAAFASLRAFILSSFCRASRFFSRLVSRSNICEIACFSLACMTARPSYKSSKHTLPFASPVVMSLPWSCRLKLVRPESLTCTLSTGSFCL